MKRLNTAQGEERNTAKRSAAQLNGIDSIERPKPHVPITAPMASKQAFRVDVRGLTDLLSERFYKDRIVFVRELLQNARDGIKAREQYEEFKHGRIDVEIVEESEGSPPVLIVQDNGLGLTEDEVEQFLATIGGSCKRDEEGRPAPSFIGEFGVGLLSCFAVSDEIRIITRSPRGKRVPLEWCAKRDGHFLRRLRAYVSFGTRVYLRARHGYEDLLDPGQLEQKVRLLGGLLHYPIYFTARGGTKRLNESPPPWRHPIANAAKSHEAMLAFGRDMFETLARNLNGVQEQDEANDISEYELDGWNDMDGKFVDAVQVRSRIGQVEGLALIPSELPQLAPPHLLYSRNIFLSNDEEDLIPNWATGFQFILNADGLTPQATRESFCRDEILHQARAELERCLCLRLARLARHAPKRFDRIVRRFEYPIKIAALENERFFRRIVDYLPFVTSHGRIPFGTYRRNSPVIRLARAGDLADLVSLTRKQKYSVILPQHQVDIAVLERFLQLFPHTQLERIDTAVLADGLDPIEPDFAPQAGKVAQLANEFLAPLRCTVALRDFGVSDRVALVAEAYADATWKSEDSQEEGLVDSPLDEIEQILSPDGPEPPLHTVHLNVRHELVKAILRIGREPLAKTGILVAYLLSMLQEHYPITSARAGTISERFIELARRLEEGHDGQN